MRTVITYGTFDLFHKGHYNILKRAKEEGDYLIVAVTGETYDNERGKLSVQDSLATRIQNVQDTGFADKIIVEEYIGQKISDILKYHVDVLVIGSDWKGKFDHLRKYCEVKYLERTKDISSTQLREEKLKIYKLGIVTDDMSDNDDILEVKKVSGIHVESVFASDAALAEEYYRKFELNNWYDDFEAFLEGIDVVYVKTKEGKRCDFVLEALDKGKHVIADAPYTLDPAQMAEVKKKAADNDVIFMENAAMLYQQTFGQILWMARGNLIGDIVNIRSSITRDMFGGESNNSVLDMAFFSVCAIVKILGTNIESVKPKIVRNKDGEVEHCLIEMEYENAVATTEVYMNSKMPTEMVIVGTEGWIEIPEDWWHGGYFKMNSNNDDRPKRYCANSDGNGFRYLVQTLMRELKRDFTGYDPQLTGEESEAICNVLGLVK